MLLDLFPQQWKLLVLSRQDRNQLLVDLTSLDHNNPIIVFDCGRQFDSSIVARAAHGRKENTDHIRIQRAFICHDVVKLLEQTQNEQTPILILDFLTTFYDENVRIHTRKYLLEKSLCHFKRLNRRAGMAVSVHPPPAAADALYLFERLQSAAPSIMKYESPVNTASQSRLF